MHYQPRPLGLLEALHFLEAILYHLIFQAKLPHPEARGTLITLITFLMHQTRTLGLLGLMHFVVPMHHQLTLGQYDLQPKMVKDLEVVVEN
jgi:nitric oxide reductase large subunit